MSWRGCIVNAFVEIAQVFTPIKVFVAAPDRVMTWGTWGHLGALGGTWGAETREFHVWKLGDRLGLGGPQFCYDSTE